MTAITVGTAAVTVPAQARTPRKGLFARLWAAFVDARMRQAEREIGLHSHLLPGELRQISDCLAARTGSDTQPCPR